MISAQRWAEAVLPPPGYCRVARQVCSKPMQQFKVGNPQTLASPSMSTTQVMISIHSLVSDMSLACGDLCFSPGGRRVG